MYLSVFYGLEIFVGRCLIKYLLGSQIDFGKWGGGVRFCLFCCVVRSITSLLIGQKLMSTLLYELPVALFVCDINVSSTNILHDWEI